MPGSIPAAAQLLGRVAVVRRVDRKADEGLDSSEAGRPGHESAGGHRSAPPPGARRRSTSVTIPPNADIWRRATSWPSWEAKPRVEDPLHLRVSLQSPRERERALALARDTKVERLQAAKRQGRGVRVHAPAEDLEHAPRRVDPLAGPDEGAADDVAVAGQRLRQAVHHQVGAEGQRAAGAPASRRCCRPRRRGPGRERRRRLSGYRRWTGSGWSASRRRGHGSWAPPARPRARRSDTGMSRDGTPRPGRTSPTRRVVPP